MDYFAESLTKTSDINSFWQNVWMFDESNYVSMWILY